MSILFPVIGTRLRLIQPWEFRLFRERRNKKLYGPLGYDDYHKRMPHAKGHDEWMILQLPTDTILRVDRIYIKKTSPHYDSITFYIESTTFSEFKNKKGLRFWAKVHDINDKMQAVFL